MRALINILFFMVAAAFIVVPIVAACIYSPLWLLLLILTFPFAIFSFVGGMYFE